jgi:hypothetical protein
MPQRLLLCVARLYLRHVHGEEGSGFVNMHYAKLILTMTPLYGGKYTPADCNELLSLS